MGGRLDWREGPVRVLMRVKTGQPSLVLLYHCILLPPLPLPLPQVLILDKASTAILTSSFKVSDVLSRNVMGM